MIVQILVPLLMGLVASVAIEQFLRPRPPLRGRSWGAWAVHCGVFVAFFAVELAIFQRPYFVSAMVLTGVLLLVLVSNAKTYALREPFIYQDFEYFLDALKHPRLYLPFMGIWRAVAALIAFIAAIYFGLMFEPSITKMNTATLASETSTTSLLLFCASLLVTAVMVVWLTNTDTLVISYEPNADLKRHGLLPFLMRYRAEERKPIDVAALNSPFNDSASNNIDKNTGQPHIIVVQSESFFDVRRIFAGLDPAVMHEWDKTTAVATISGRVEVAAWGANTVRTEFAFLSGLAADQLGVHRFNPYRKMALQGVPTLATFLKKLGYRTLCMHPYPASFYTRNQVFPVLGFDEFIDIRAFSDADKCGPYVGDIAVAEKVKSVLNNSTQPTFIFVITMENHGPLHWENVTPQELATLFSTPPPAHCEELAVYARHLRNANTMLGNLRSHLETITTPSWLCWYGDHVPIMPQVYAALGEPDGATDFFIWGNKAVQKSQPNTPVLIKNLAGNVLVCAGFSVDEPSK